VAGKASAVPFSPRLLRRVEDAPLSLIALKPYSSSPLGLGDYAPGRGLAPVVRGPRLWRAASLVEQVHPENCTSSHCAAEQVATGRPDALPLDSSQATSKSGEPPGRPPRCAPMSPALSWHLGRDGQHAPVESPSCGDVGASIALLGGLQRGMCCSSAYFLAEKKKKKKEGAK